MRKTTTNVKSSQASAVAAKLGKEDAKRKTKLKPYKAGRKTKKMSADEEEDEDADFFKGSPKSADLGNDFFYDDDDDDDFFFDDNPFYN